MYLRVMTSFCSYALTINFVNTVCLRACISLGEFKVACWRDHVVLSMPGLGLELDSGRRKWCQQC